MQRNTFLQTVVSAYVSPKASVAEDYDFSLPTYINHRHPHYVAEKADGTSSRAKYREDVHGPVYGSYAALRKELDYSWCAGERLRSAGALVKSKLRLILKNVSFSV